MKLLVIPIVLALAGAGLSGAVLTGALPLMKTSAPAAPAAGPAGWSVVQAFTGDVGADVTQGTLDLRTFTGTLHVVGWDQDKYEITVLQKDQKRNTIAGDRGIDAVFEETRDGGLGLKLSVNPKGSYSVSTTDDGTFNIGDGDQVIGVIANVPARLDWSAVRVCSGLTGGFGLLTPDMIPLPFGGRDSDAGDSGCVKGQQSFAVTVGTAPLPGSNDAPAEKNEGIPFALESLHGGQLLVAAQYASLGVQDLRFQEAALLTQYGDLKGGLEAPKIAAGTQYGGITLKTTVDELKAVSQYGNVRILVLGGGSGSYDVSSQYGNVNLGVPGGANRGYDASASAQYGKAIIKLSDTEPQEEGADAVPSAGSLGSLDLTKAMAAKKPRHNDEEGSIAKAKTNGFDAREIQVKVSGVAQYGDVLITDGDLPKERPSHSA